MDTAVMQIGSGQSALSLSLLKALGAQSGAQNATQNASPSGAAAAPADTRAATAAAARTDTSSQASPQTSPQASRSGVAAKLQPAATIDGTPPPPRGSFVDLRA